MSVGQDQWDGMVRNVGILAEQSRRHDARFEEVSADLKEVTRELRNVANRLEERHGVTADTIRGEFHQQLHEGGERQARFFTWMIAIASIIVTVAMAALGLWFQKEHSATETRFEQEQKRTDDRFQRLIETMKEVQVKDAQMMRDLREDMREHAGKNGHPETVILATERNKSDISGLNAHVARLDEALDQVRASWFSRDDWDAANLRIMEREQHDRERSEVRDEKLADRVSALEARAAAIEAMNKVENK